MFYPTAWLSYNICLVSCRYINAIYHLIAVYLDKNCGDSSQINGQIRLQLTRSSSYSPNLDCQLTLEANYGHRMMMFFRSLNIENQGTCDFDWVEINDGQSTSNAYITGNDNRVA